MEPFENLRDAIIERNRLSKLSNEDLCREYLKLKGDDDKELHACEMIRRLWPQWSESEL